MVLINRAQYLRELALGHKRGSFENAALDGEADNIDMTIGEAYMYKYTTYSIYSYMIGSLVFRFRHQVPLT